MSQLARPSGSSQPTVSAVRVSLRALAVLVTALLMLSGVAVAQEADTTLAPGDRGEAVVALQRTLGVTADGVYGPETRRAVRRFQRKRGIRANGVAGPATLEALGVRAAAPATTTTAHSALERIAQCESGGDPTAVSADGTYRGKYQFSRDTWRALGGTGDPAAAPEAEQDRLAAKLLAASGTSPWPNCA